MNSSDRLQFEDSKPIEEMSMVDIASQLERITSWIEAQRSEEREARTVYQAVQTRVEANIARIREYAEKLLARQNAKSSSFAGMLGQEFPPPPSLAEAATRPLSRSAQPVSHQGGRPMAFQLREPKNIAEAILAIWSIDRYQESLTTEEIADALHDVGYRSEAAPTSLKSSINQALAKLCRVGRVVRFRSDGTIISPRDRKSRARKYIAATRLPEDVIPE